MGSVILTGVHSGIPDITFENILLIRFWREGVIDDLRLRRTVIAGFYKNLKEEEFSKSWQSTHLSHWQSLSS